MLTILHTESSEGWGGQENRTIEECVGLRKMGFRVIVLSRPGARIKAKAEVLGIETRTHPMRFTYDIAAIRHVLRIIKEDSVDVINTHSGVDSFIASVAGRLSKRGPAIVRTRHLALPITSKASYSMLPHRVVTVSEFVRGHLVNGRGIDAKKVVAIPTGVDLKRFDPANVPDTLRKELGLDDRARVVGTVAILRKKKGHSVLLEAIPEVLKSVPSAVFVFAGDGPQRENIEKRIGELKLGRSVRLLGLRDDVPSVMKGLDLFVLPTLQEALGTSVIEASAMGKAVVASRAGGVPEVVKDHVTGLLVEPDDPGELALAIIELLLDEGMRAEMGREARAFVEREFSTERMVERMFRLYNELVDERKGFRRTA